MHNIKHIFFDKNQFEEELFEMAWKNKVTTVTNGAVHAWFLTKPDVQAFFKSKGVDPKILADHLMEMFEKDAKTNGHMWQRNKKNNNSGNEDSRQQVDIITDTTPDAWFEKIQNQENNPDISDLKKQFRKTWNIDNFTTRGIDEACTFAQMRGQTPTNFEIFEIYCTSKKHLSLPIAYGDAGLFEETVKSDENTISMGFGPVHINPEAFEEFNPLTADYTGILESEKNNNGRPSELTNKSVGAQEIAKNGRPVSAGDFTISLN